MEDYKVERVKKIASVSVVLLVLIVVVLVAYFTTGVVIENSYKTEDIFETEATEGTEKESSGYSEDDIANMSETDKMLALINDIDTSDLKEASVKKATIFLSCSESPWYKYMATAEYEVGKVSKGYKVDYKINGEELSVICSWYDATPVVFIKDVEFTDEEKEFFRKVGKSWEVQLDDGTYSIQYR